MLCNNLLPLVGVQIFQVSSGDRRDAASLCEVVHNGNRGLCQNTHGRHQDFKIAFTFFSNGPKGFTLPCDQHISESTHCKSFCCFRCTAGENGCVPVQSRYKFLCLLLRAPVLKGVAPRSKIVPTSSPGTLWIRSDDGNSLPCEIVPVPDLLRIPLAGQKHYGGRKSRRYCRKAFYANPDRSSQHSR